MGFHQIYEVTPTFTLHAFIIHPTSLLEMWSRDLISYQKHKSEFFPVGWLIKDQSWLALAPALAVLFFLNFFFLLCLAMTTLPCWTEWHTCIINICPSGPVRGYRVPGVPHMHVLDAPHPAPPCKITFIEEQSWWEIQLCRTHKTKASYKMEPGWVGVASA